MDKATPNSEGLDTPQNFRQQLSLDVFHNYSLWLYIAAAALYILGVWEHIPYAGGHIYSDLVSVFDDRFLSFCSSTPCSLGVPYINNFVEYPVLVGFFMWAMGSLGAYIPISLPPDQLGDYYTYSSIFLLIPTFLLIRETLKIAEILGVAQKHKRTFLFLVATPSFIFMLLLNWYIIGTFFAIYGLRKFLEGSRIFSGAMLGISALSNFVTFVPAIGMLFGANSWRERFNFLIGVGIALVTVYIPLLIANSFPHTYISNPPFSSGPITNNLPFIPLNTNIITDFLSYQQNWYIEGSWMLAFINNLDPLRHYIFPILFVALSVAILYRGINFRRTATTPQERAKLVVSMSSLFTFAFLFSTYVCTPQMNIILLPFFVLLPIASYPEFLAFDVVNSLVIVWGFSGSLMFLGLNYSVPLNWLFQNPGTPVWSAPNQLFAVIRSLWIGKFLIFDGLIFPRWQAIAAKASTIPPMATKIIAESRTENLSSPKADI